MMTLEFFLFLIGKTIDGVVNGEDVLGIEGLLHLLHEVEGGVWVDLLHESLADLADTVMVRKTATLLDDFVSAFVLDFFVNMHDLIFRDVGVGIVVTEIDIDCGSGLIDLGHTEGYEEAILLDATI
jgi:hypothetical protein